MNDTFKPLGTPVYNPLVCENCLFDNTLRNAQTPEENEKLDILLKKQIDRHRKAEQNPPMKRYHKYTFTRREDFIFFRLPRKNQESLQICSDFVRAVVGLIKRKTALKVSIAIRKKNPKEKGFLPLTFNKERGYVFLRGKRFYVCDNELEYLQENGFGDKFWVKIEVLG